MSSHETHDVELSITAKSNPNATHIESLRLSLLATDASLFRKETTIRLLVASLEAVLQSAEDSNEKGTLLSTALVELNQLWQSHTASPQEPVESEP